MTSIHTTSRVTGVLLVTSVSAMIAAAVVAVPSGLTLNPADPAAALAAVHARPATHLAELGLDVIGWLALVAAALRMAATGPRAVLLPAGLLGASGLAGLLHDAGNLALTQLAAAPADPATTAAATVAMLVAKWTVNLAGLLWVAATATAATQLRVPAGLRRTGLLAATSGLAAVVLPWTTGTAGPSVAVEQLGYLLHLPVMIWFCVLGFRRPD
jgi:hypothetical protein